MDSLRIGHGFDVHRLVEGRPLVIGGVRIPFEKGLLGHSDADVVLHALSDALLGAAGLPDIGHYFAPSDIKWKDAESASLLHQVRDIITESGCTAILNVDVVIMAEKPRFQDHIPAMKTRISGILGVSERQVGIKATTCEKLGFIGREEGIAATAICLIAIHD